MKSSLSKFAARLTFGVALFSALFSPLRAEEKAHKHHGGMQMKKGPDLSTAAAFDGDGRLWAVYKQEGKIVLSRSEDLGKTWSAPVLISDEPTDPGADARPKLAFGRTGEVYLTWTHPMSKPFSGEIRFTRSLDGGKTFSAPITVHADPQEITHRFDAITVAPNGTVFVAWIDKRDVVAAQNAGAEYRGAAVYFAVSKDQGATFQGDYKVVDNSCECCRVALTTTTEGEVVALWRHIFEPNVRDHAMATLRADGTCSPMRRASFEDWKVDACPHHGPALAGGEGKMHAVWFTQSPKSPGVFYCSFRNERPDTPKRVGDDTAERPDIAASGDSVALTWKQFDGVKSQLCGMLSKDGGMTWKELSLASAEGASDHPRILTHKGQFYVLWNSRSAPLSVVTFP